MHLSQHFTLAELTFSRTATASGIDNTPGDAERSNLEALCRLVLDPLRDAAGAAIKVTSGYRGPVLNAAIKGERKSQHLEGKAADIQPTSMTVLELFKTVIRSALPFDQLIYEPKSATSKWVHVSHNAASNRGQILRAHFLPTGKVERYEPLTAAQALELQEAVTRSSRRLDEMDYDEIDDEPGEEAASPALPPQQVAARTVAAKKPPAGKAPAKKVARKTSAKTASAKKAPAARTAAKKKAGTKTVAKKAAPRKAAGKPKIVKSPAVKKAAVKKAAVKKPAAKKSAPRMATRSKKTAR